MPLKKYQTYIVTLAPLILIVLIGYFFFDIFTYITLAWILSMIGAPLHNKLRKVVGNSGAAALTLFTFLILVLAIIWLFIPPILQQARQFATVDYEGIVNSFEEPLNDWNEWLVDKGILQSTDPLPVDTTLINDSDEHIVEVFQLDSLLKDTVNSGVTIVVQVNNNHKNGQGQETEPIQITDSFVDRARKNIVSFINPARISQVFNTIVGALGNILITLMSVFFIAFFFLREQGLFTSMVKSITPNNQEDNWTHAIDESTNLLKRYFIGIMVQIFIITLFVTTALHLLGFQNALLIGFFAALMNVIPYIGPILGAIFGAIIVISSNLDLAFYDEILPKVGMLALVFGGMQLFDNLVVQPNVFSRSVKAHPLEIFIVILAGAKIGGVLGMIVAIPIYTILRVLAKVFLSEFKVVQRITNQL